MPFTEREKVFCVLEQSHTKLQRAFVREFVKNAPTAMQIWT